ncbi:MAG: hypothetical protein HFI31_02895 [Lachnospiraceae bacterium]|jgi:hypothetical protein|nr:hypothetical protein [Lachnospiraceae bacterium]MCI9133125.1 hypothetical protein [Lachnospiraceae bacterium]
MEQQNGNLIRDLVSKLHSTDKYWELYVLEENRERSENIGSLLNRLLQSLRNVWKQEGRERGKKELKKAGVTEKACEALMEETERTLRFYIQFEPLRDLDSRDRVALKGLILSIYQKYIVRLEPGYIKMLNLEGIRSEELQEIARYMDYMTDFYVSRSYTRWGIIRDLLDESGLSEEICDYWAELIEQNYMQLKMNYIVESLESIKEKL